MRDGLDEGIRNLMSKLWSSLHMKLQGCFSNLSRLLDTFCEASSAAMLFSDP